MIHSSMRSEACPFVSPPEYWILLEKANTIFYDGVAAVAGREGYDLVGEIGAIRIKGKKIPDITKKVIEEVKDKD